MCLVVFEAVEVLIPLLTDVALVWFLLFHTHGSRIRCLSVGINDGEGAISVLMEALVVMPVCFVIFQAILILVGLLAANYGAPEWFRFFVRENIGRGVG